MVSIVTCCMCICESSMYWGLCSSRIWWGSMRNWILTFQRKIFSSSSRVKSGLTDRWSWILCVLLKHQKPFTLCYNVVSQKHRNPQLLRCKNLKIRAAYICLYCFYLTYGTNHFLPNNMPWPFLIPTNTSKILI